MLSILICVLGAGNQQGPACVLGGKPGAGGSSSGMAAFGGYAGDGEQAFLCGGSPVGMLVDPQARLCDGDPFENGLGWKEP